MEKTGIESTSIPQERALTKPIGRTNWVRKPWVPRCEGKSTRRKKTLGTPRCQNFSSGIQQPDGKYYCHAHDDSGRINPCQELVTHVWGENLPTPRPCGRSCALGYDRCHKHGGPVPKHRLYGSRSVGSNLRNHLNNQLVRHKVDRLASQNIHPLEQALNVLNHQIAIVQIAVEEFEQINDPGFRGNSAPYQNGENGAVGTINPPSAKVYSKLDDLERLSKLGETAGKAAERYIKMSAQFAMTDAEINRRKARIIEKVRQVMRKWVPKENLDAAYDDLEDEDFDG